VVTTSPVVVRPRAPQALRSLERGHPIPDDYAKAFAFWCRRSRGTFPYPCSGCGSCRELHERIVPDARGCSSCGTLVTVADIDFVLATWEPERRRIIRRAKLSCTIAVLVVVLGLALVMLL
jgi:hypothetical protein